MKLALLVIAVVLLLWLLRGARRGVSPPPEKPHKTPTPSAEPQPMLSCAHCGLHLPRDEALPGRGGVFCGEAHRKAFEQAHPGS